EKQRLEHTQRAVLNILEDFQVEKTNLGLTQRATTNILDDFDAERKRLQDTQRAVLNIMEDFNQSNEQLQQLGKMLEVRVAERTQELQRAIERLTSEIENRKKVEEALRRKSQELLVSNSELDQFAYIASHDLQEPLRMVASYVQMLGIRYEGKLDKDADEYLGYLHGSAQKMKQMLDGLMAYSEVNKQAGRFTRVSLEEALAKALDGLKALVEASDAEITHGPLPEVPGDFDQIVRVFLSLVGNAVKFRSKERPLIHVSAQLEEGQWTIAVKDNGIGIDPAYRDRVFLPFQRFHRKEEYQGTGIGLAITKRIIERHNGRIWFDSEPGKGSTFFFTLPMVREAPSSV
ncbi:MAG: hypothetical protein HYX90_07210, partial [Chloroflexi bacterium]|nr:hypothetical protein [Chloroflexota bacterium]